MLENIRQFVVRLLLEKGPLPTHTSIDEYRYLDTGHIDSLGFIKFIFRIEEQFHVQFSEYDIVSPQIRTVGGIVAIIASKLEA